MSERYIQKYLMPEMLYLEGSPVVICAGALLDDVKLDRIVLQLKLKNIGEKAVKEAKVAVLPIGPNQDETRDAVSYVYKHRNVARGEYFGQQSAIVIPYPMPQEFKIQLVAVKFDDGEIWKGPNEVWKPFTLDGSLNKVLNADEDLINQYKLEFGSDCDAIFGESAGLWQCICGEYNYSSEESCYKCGRAYKDMSVADLDVLQTNCQQRLEKERIEREEQEKLRRKKKNKRIALIVIIALLVSAAAVAIGISVSNMKKAAAYEEAIAMLEEGEYPYAFAAFEELGDYKDSQKYVKYDEEYTSYYRALHNWEIGDYSAAIGIFEELGNFEDAPAMLEKTKEEALVKCKDFIENHKTNGSLMAKSDIEDCKDAMLLLTGEQIKEEIVGLWATFYSMGEPMTMKYNSDGTAEFKREGKDPSEMKWKVEGDSFFYTGADSGDLWGTEYELRKFDDNTLLLIRKESDNLYNVLFKK